MTTRRAAGVAVLCLALAGCAASDNGSETASGTMDDAEAVEAGSMPAEGASGSMQAGSAMDPRVERAVMLAREIRKTPEQAETILADAGMTAETFDDLLYEISMDPELSRQYAAALASP